jgi:hypothetical protein
MCCLRRGTSPTVREGSERYAREPSLTVGVVPPAESRFSNTRLGHHERMSGTLSGEVDALLVKRSTKSHELKKFICLVRVIYWITFLGAANVLNRTRTLLKKKHARPEHGVQKNLVLR